MPKIAIVLGSPSDKPYLEGAKKYLEYFWLDFDIHIISAHRDPQALLEFTSGAEEKGYKIIIAAAGMAAHLAGAIAAQTTLPVLGVPLPGGMMDGLDALLSTVQMPAGIPVATFAVGKAGMCNAVVFAARLLAINDENIKKKIMEFKAIGSRL